MAVPISAAVERPDVPVGVVVKGARVLVSVDFD
jgi:hypothetical protein